MTLKHLKPCGTLLIFAVFIILLQRATTVTAAPAAICTWPNSTTGSWTDASKWSCGVVPGPNDDVNVGLGAVVILDTDATINKLMMMGGTISGTHALAVTDLVDLNPSFNVIIHTQGSRLPRFISAPGAGVIVRLTDPALTADSLSMVTISNPIGSNGSTIFEIGPRSISTLIMHNGNFGVTSDLTVTQLVSWTSG
ncbi:MAG TPA: hypothetical protein VLG46_03600, partial [Anaerolineae bacterium]|nr:hypothetical protein [Anaerolineae bacterium]